MCHLLTTSGGAPSPAHWGQLTTHWVWSPNRTGEKCQTAAGSKSCWRVPLFDAPRASQCTARSSASAATHSSKPRRLELERLLALLLGPNPERVLDVRHKNLAIADLSRASRLDDGLHSRRHLLVRQNNLKLDLG